MAIHLKLYWVSTKIMIRYMLYHKRLERGTFELPFFDTSKKAYKMPYKTFSAIMSGICLKSLRYRKRLNIG